MKRAERRRKFRVRVGQGCGDRLCGLPKDVAVGFQLQRLGPAGRQSDETAEEVLLEWPFPVHLFLTLME